MYIWSRDTNDKYYTRATLLDEPPKYFFKENNQTLNLGTIKDAFYPVRVWAKDDLKKIADYFVCSGMYIVSKGLKELLETENVESTVEFFPLEIVAGKRVQKEISKNSYFLMNFLGNIDCFNLEKSIYTRVNEWTVRHIDKLVLDESKIPLQTKIFYIFPFISKIAVRDELAEKVLAGKFKGISLTRVEETKIL